MTKIAYVDHSYHKKTLSTAFIPEILTKYGHEIDFFWDEYWTGGEKVNLDSVKNYDIIILFQSDLEMNGLNYAQAHPNIISIPMLDQFEQSSGALHNYSAYFERFQGTKLISFSKGIYAMATLNGIRALQLQYYQKAKKNVCKWDNLNAFFWIRTEDKLSWKTIRELINGTNFASFHIHSPYDPGTNKPEMPSLEDIAKYNITSSNWFANKEDYYKVLNKANVFFAPRLDEGIGQSFLEAFSSGQCVVAADFGTMNEYILHGVNGLLFDPKNPMPLDFSNAKQIGNCGYESAKIGYEKFVAKEKEIVDFILSPSSKIYEGYYQHDFNLGLNINTRLSKHNIKNKIKSFKVVQKNHFLWQPIWNSLRQIAQKVKKLKS